MEEVLGNYAPHSVIGLALIFIWILVKGYIRKVEHLAEIAATKKELAAVEDRLNSSVDRLREEQSARDERLEKRLDDGFAGVHGRMDRIFRFGPRNDGS